MKNKNIREYENPFTRNKTYVELDSEIYNELVKYAEEVTKYGVAVDLSGLIDRIIVTWYQRMLPEWMKKPKLRPKDLTGKAPSNLNQIKANKDHAKNFNRYCQALNYNPAELLTYLAKGFVKKWELHKRQELLKKRNIMK